MKCDLCGSKKNVRKFYAPIRKTYYTECRKCFEEVVKMMNFPKEEIEKEWNSGSEK